MLIGLFLCVWALEYSIFALNMRDEGAGEMAGEEFFNLEGAQVVVRAGVPRLQFRLENGQIAETNCDLLGNAGPTRAEQEALKDEEERIAEEQLRLEREAHEREDARRRTAEETERQEFARERSANRAEEARQREKEEAAARPGSRLESAADLEPEGDGADTSADAEKSQE